MEQHRNHTKIVATISDDNCEVDFIQSLYDLGMNVARINTAHQEPATSAELVKNVRVVSDKIAILVDTKGPEIRTIPTGGVTDINTGDKITILGGAGDAAPGVIRVDYVNFIKDVPAGCHILIDDGDIELFVDSKDDSALYTTACNSSSFKGKKSINVPDVTFNLPSISAKDETFIEWAADMDLEFIAHSFVRNAADVIAVQNILDKKGSKAKIIAKIENQAGIDNIDEILEHAYGIMIARGDLAIEVQDFKVPSIQRDLINKCIARKKPVIIATQMLHSMIKEPRPTRAEISDIANAIYCRTDAVMLSGETAYGKYPKEAIKVMSKVIREVETKKLHRNDIAVVSGPSQITSFLAESAVKSTRIPELNATAIVTDSASGRTARYLSAFRADTPIFAKCYEERVMRELSLSYGVVASSVSMNNKDQLISSALEELIEDNKIERTDNIVYLGGSFGNGQGTTFMEIGSAEKLAESHKKMTN